MVITRDQRVKRAMRVLDNPSTKWICADEFALRLARSRIRQARISKGLTQDKLARRLHIPRSLISRIELAPKQSMARNLKRIAKKLSVDISALVP